MEDTKKATQEAAELEKNNCSAKVENILETAKQIGNGNVSLSPSLENSDTHTNNGQAKPGRAIGMPQRVMVNVPNKPKEETWKPGGATAPPADDLKTFPIWGLPEDLQQVIKAVSDGYQCDPSIVTAAIFSAAGTALGKSVVGISDNYRNYPALWFVIVGKAGVAGKTTPIEWIFKPLTECDKRAYNNYLNEKAAYNLQPKDKRGEPPRLRSKIASQITDERLLYKLADNNGALCWKHDELETLLGGMGKYSSGGAGMIVGNLLTIFSGVSFTKESVSGEPIMIDSPALNIITTTQPATLKRLMTPYLQNGFFERFVYINIAGNVPEYKPIIIADDTRRTWGEYIDRLIRNDVGELREHPAAYKTHVAAMNRWRNEERGLMMMDSGDLMDDVSCSILEKTNYQLCRLSIIAAMLNGDNIISPTVMDYAVNCCDYFIKQQKDALFQVLHGNRRGEPTLADVLRQLYRCKPDLNQSELARSLGTSQQYVNKILNQK